ncbi:hypothetical protein K501DRAFT_211341 [Backusella circina FSU 941]|nr:hypothetical protein K501DRAFT_211341 [Backusella circina FSU 941]
MVLLASLETYLWVNQGMILLLDYTEDKLLDLIHIVSYCILWVLLLTLSICSPNRNYYNRQYFTTFFTFIYSVAFFDALYMAFISEFTESFYSSNIYTSFILFILAGLTPRPVHPRDVDVTETEHVEIRNGAIYRENHHLSPESSASIFSRLTFEWMTPLIFLSRKTTIDPANLYSLTFQQLPRSAHQDFTATLKKIASNRIMRRLYESNKAEIWAQFVLTNIGVFLNYLTPYFQQKLLEYIENQDGRPVSLAYQYVFAGFAVTVVKTIIAGIALYAGRRWDIRTRGMLCAEIFSKTMRRKDMSGKLVDEEDKENKEKSKNDEKDFSNSGKITNLMSMDSDLLADFGNFCPFFYNPPLEVIIALCYLYQLLGNATLVGVAVMLSLFPVTAYISHKLTSSYLNLATKKDHRNELITEMLQGIRMIKYFAWEKNWIEKVAEARNVEIDRLVTKVKLNIMMRICYLAVPVMVTASSFIWYTKVSGNELTASVAFVSITLFEMLRKPLLLIPDNISSFTEVYVSFKRISGYMDEPEIDDKYKSPVIAVPEGTSPESVLSRVGFEESVFAWHDESNDGSTVSPASSSSSSEINSPSADSTLNNTPTAIEAFQLRVPKMDLPIGKLTLVCGPTGSGKTSFLHALLGEMDIVSGRAYLPSKTVIDVPSYSRIDPENPNLYLDRVAYAAQQPFLRHASIRDNILFGLPFDPVRYKTVLKQCALIKDLSIFPDGDRTEIGEKGISLSGGQKQRVSLARSIYSYAKTVILDDCLSAVDAHTAKYIYKNCITGSLLKGRTVILVTHHVRLCVSGAHSLVRIERGNVVSCDTVENIRQNGLLQEYVGKDTLLENEVEDAIENEEEIDEELDLDLDNQKDVTKLVQDEKREEGKVKIKVYATYLGACGGWLFWITLLLFYVIARLISFSENWWLRIWAAAYSTTGNQNNQDGLLKAMSTGLVNQGVFEPWVIQEKEPIDVDYYIGIYVIICSMTIILNTIKFILLYWGTIRGSRVLFNALTKRIIHAPMRFFDTTPLGRILNRFGKDITAIDMQLAEASGKLIECTTEIVASVLVITAITPQFLTVAILIGFLYIIVGNLYRHISRDLKRLSSVGTSPIYSHFTESLTGVTTIRAYGAEHQFINTLYEKVNDFVAPYYFLWMCNRWLYARVEFIGGFVSLFTGVFLILNLGKIDAGMAGISLFYARGFLESVYWFIRQYTTVEMYLNSVERVQEYLEIDQEPPAYIEGHRAPAAWPTTASVEVNNLVIRYSDELDPVLHGVSFTTKPHEKVGIVGRTGSGKSTLGLSIFRFLEASSGSIVIDGIDISKIGIEDLRLKMTIVPQDAILFSGTIRSNLDPFDEHTDQAIWDSLERAHIAKRPKSNKSSVHSIENASSSDTNQEMEESQGFVSNISSLEQKVSDGGCNFSQGQRQLLCLARALLRNSKLIIMDEATASIDYETDAKIQETIRKEFADSTLLTIAHRLLSIIDYDRVLVLDQGRIVENDTPYNLIQSNGIFRSMCEQSGEFNTLLSMATASHAQKEQEEEQHPDNHANIY